MQNTLFLSCLNVYLLTASPFTHLQIVFQQTNATSLRSDRSDTAESDQETMFRNESPTDPIESADSTPEQTNENTSPSKQNAKSSPKLEENNFHDVARSTPEKLPNSKNNLKENKVPEDDALPQPQQQELASPKTESIMFLQNEMSSPPKKRISPKNEQKFGRKFMHVFNKIVKKYSK